MSDTFIHPMAVVEKGAELGAGVSIGPFCHVSAHAVIGDGSRLVSNISILGATTLGAGCEVHPMSVLGAPPQNFKHKGGRTTLTIGRDCVIREGVTMHLGSDTDRGATLVGDNCYFMNHVHIGHDCHVGNRVIMASVATLGGHAEIGDRVSIGGLSAVHQFVRIGHDAFIGGMTAVVGDVIPYAMAAGNRARLRGLNVVGLRRSGRTSSELRRMREAYRAIFGSGGGFSDNLAKAAETYADFEPAMEIVDFLSARGKRQFTLPDRGGADDDADAGGH